MERSLTKEDYSDSCGEIEENIVSIKRDTAIKIEYCIVKRSLSSLILLMLDRIEHECKVSFVKRFPTRLPKRRAHVLESQTQKSQMNAFPSALF